MKTIDVNLKKRRRSVGIFAAYHFYLKVEVEDEVEDDFEKLLTDGGTDAIPVTLLPISLLCFFYFLPYIFYKKCFNAFKFTRFTFLVGVGLQFLAVRPWLKSFYAAK